LLMKRKTTISWITYYAMNYLTTWLMIVGDHYPDTAWDCIGWEEDMIKNSFPFWLCGCFGIKGQRWFPCRAALTFSFLLNPGLFAKSATTLVMSAHPEHSIWRYPLIVDDGWSHRMSRPFRVQRASALCLWHASIL
jgi:hypothetical protein